MPVMGEIGAPFEARHQLLDGEPRPSGMQLELIQPHAQHTFDFLVKYVEQS
jgi:hypothetical protein